MTKTKFKRFLREKPSDHPKRRYLVWFRRFWKARPTQRQFERALNNDIIYASTLYILAKP